MKLEVLNLRETNIGDRGAKYLSKQIDILSNLKTLILEGISYIYMFLF